MKSATKKQAPSPKKKARPSKSKPAQKPKAPKPRATPAQAKPKASKPSLAPAKAKATALPPKATPSPGAKPTPKQPPKAAAKRTQASTSKRSVAKPPPTPAPLESAWLRVQEEAKSLGVPLVVAASVARPLQGGAVDVAGLGAGAFVTIGPASEVPRLVATVVAAWASVLAPSSILIAGDRSLLNGEGALSALASKLGREVRFRLVPELEVDRPDLARLATLDRGARRALLTSVALHEHPADPVRIDPLALEDAASQRPVKMVSESADPGHAYRVGPARRT